MRSRRLPTSFFWMFTCGAFRLHSAGVSLCIPPVAPADVPAITAQDLGHLPAVLLDYSRIVLNFRSGVMCRAIAPLRFLDEK